ncbi:MAG: energy transducer TonB [Muribaculaceae bacterium]|nr:energy transducer TonB [Muribaculaceae bacterium]
MRVARAVNRDLDREAIRLCKMLPDFTPGRNALGEPVSVWYTLPVSFKLPNNN